MRPESSVNHRCSHGKRIMAALVAGVITASLFGCVAASNSDSSDSSASSFLSKLKGSFASKGSAGLDRLDQDDVQRLCTAYAGQPLPPDVQEKIQQSQLASIKKPASGNLIGDWKAGEAIAQEGRGLQFSDPVGGPQGGNCYACHQLAPEEISFGTLGPSLLHYGKLRGQSPAIVEYTYNKIYNSQAYAACTGMPRFGHNHILTPEQIADVVALLLDPQSPVNR